MDKEIFDGYTCSEQNYNNIEVNRKEKFLKEQIELRKKQLDL